MKDWIHLPLAAVVAGLIGYGSTLLSAPERGARGAETAPGDLEARLEALRAEQERLAARLEALPGVTAPTDGGRSQTIDLDQAIAAYMARELSAADAPALDAVEHAADPESVAIADRILSGEVSGDELARLWQRLRDEGRIDGVLAEIEHQAKLSPSNPDLQNEYGKACLQKLFDVGMGPMAAAWGEKADQAFDRALELDDSHWDARFQKAMALSNWPSFLGKQGESMHQFEILMDRQERGAPDEKHAMTYYFLGNLYDQKGDHAKAVATWERGANRFPTNERLRRKLEDGR